MSVLYNKVIAFLNIDFMVPIIACLIIIAFSIYVLYIAEKQKKAPLLDGKNLLDD